MIRRSGLAALAALALGAPAAQAQVLEIGDQGAVTVYAAPSVFTADGVTPINPPARRAPEASRAEVSAAMAEASARYAVPMPLMQAVAWRESRYRQAALSPKGAIGVMQLMGPTARGLGVDPYDLRQNIQGGAAYLSQMLTRYRGDTGLALAAYNAGPAAVDRHGGVPPFQETQRYVSAIMAWLPHASTGAAAPYPLLIVR